MYAGMSGYESNKSEYVSNVISIKGAASFAFSPILSASSIWKFTADMESNPGISINFEEGSILKFFISELDCNAAERDSHISLKYLFCMGVIELIFKIYGTIP